MPANHPRRLAGHAGAHPMAGAAALALAMAGVCGVMARAGAEPIVSTG
jgi:hypothetical protein